MEKIIWKIDDLDFQNTGDATELDWKWRNNLENWQIRFSNYVLCVRNFDIYLQYISTFDIYLQYQVEEKMAKIEKKYLKCTCEGVHL